jgi:ABC-type transport system substrate-binding protein
VFSGVDYADLQTDPHSTTQCVGTGPFKQTGFVSTIKAALQAHQAYTLGPPYIQNWILNYHALNKADNTNATAAVERGDIQVMFNPQGATYDHLKSLPNAKFIGGPVLVGNDVAFDLRSPAVATTR